MLSLDMIYRKLAKIMTVLVLAACSVQVSAQKDSLRDIEVEILTNYRPQLAAANKIPTKPFIDEPKTLLPEFSYKIPQFRYRVNPVYKPADAIKIKSNKETDLTGNYFRFGFGNLVSPLAEVHLHNGRNKQYNFGLHAKHFSSNNGKPANADFNDNLVSVYGNKKSSKGKVFGSLDYERNGMVYYGYGHDTIEFSKKDIKSAYNAFRGKTFWDNYSEKKKVGVNLGLNFEYKTNGTTDELQIMGSNYLKFKTGKGNLSFTTSYDFHNLNNDSGQLIRNFIQFQPKYSFKRKKLFFELGLKVVDVIDSSGNDLKVFPVAHFHHFIVPKKMKFYANLGGGVNKNSFSELSSANPFLIRSYDTKTGYEVFKIEAGIVGLVVKKLDYHIGVEFRSNNDFALYVTDTAATHPFNIVYSDLNITTLKLMFDFNHNEKWLIQMGGNFHSYSAKDEPTAWQLPAFDARMSISTLIAKKLRISAQALAIGERIQRDPENPNNEINLGTILDVNLHAEYYYKPHMSFFLNANNLTNQKYQYWNFYPQYGINVLAGINFSI
jgi:hypothetical protein